MNLTAPIVAVTVYPDRARITRRGTLKLGAGEHTLTLADLPTTLIEDSVRASGSGAGVKILGVDVVSKFVTQPPEARIAELIRQLETLQAGDQALSDQDKTREAQFAFLATLSEAAGRALAKGIAFGNASVARAQEFAGYVAQERDALNTQRRAIAQQRRDQKRAIEAMQAQLQQLQQGEQNERREICVNVEASADTQFELEVQYAAHGATWEPLYDLRLTDAQIALTYLANVRQQTGEDWNAVELTLSTARPAEFTEIPELDPWYVDALRPPPPMPQRVYAPSMAAGAPAPAPMMARLDRAMPEAEPPAGMLEATVEATGAAVTYRVARPATIPADNSPRKTQVTTLELAAQLDYVTAPKLAEEAYQRAKIKNASPFVLLAGKANIFHGADFVGATQIETVAANAEFETQLGADDRIKVERKLTERTVDKTLIGNTRRMAFAYKITLTNLLATPAKIVLLDQLPVARNEEIKVKLREALPKSTEQSDLNILKWELECKPQEKREVTFEFTLEHPRDMRLTGLTD